MRSDLRHLTCAVLGVIGTSVALVACATPGAAPAPSSGTSGQMTSTAVPPAATGPPTPKMTGTSDALALVEAPPMPPPTVSGPVLVGPGAAWTAPAGRWEEGQRRGPFVLDFTGYGVATAAPTEVTIAPKSAGGAARTHGTLVTSSAVHAGASISARITTTAQLRRGSKPNPWEVGWLLWAVSDSSHFYAVVLKPNGWEMSKQDPAYPGGQRFLASGSTPTFAVGVPHDLVVTHRGGIFSVWADGAPLAQVTDRERPYGPGRIGLYTEDARVLVSALTVASS